ncbi:MAG: nucleotidyltransferase family protein [Cyanobacteria bacterium J06621_3]
MQLAKSMEPLETIKAKLESIKPTLQNEYHITDFGVFGSYVRGDQTENSDVDILVVFDPSFDLDLITYCHIQNYISDTLNVKVDLVTKKSLKPYIGESILREVIYLWSNETSEPILMTS